MSSRGRYQADASRGCPAQALRGAEEAGFDLALLMLDPVHSRQPLHQKNLYEQTFLSLS